MPFPLSCTILAVPLHPDATPASERLRTAVREWLARQGAEFGDPEQGSVSFRVPFDLSELLALKPSVLFPFDGGRIITTVEAGVPRVGIRFSTKRLCAVIGLGALALGTFGAANGGASLALGFAVAVWILVFGFHYVMGASRAGGHLAELAASERDAGAAPPDAGGSSDQVPP
jgi:hypothetical protein